MITFSIFHCTYKIIIKISVKNEEAESIYYYVTALDKDGNKLSAGELVKQRYYHAFILIKTTQYYYIFSKVQTGIEIFRLEQVFPTCGRGTTGDTQRGPSWYAESRKYIFFK